MKLTEQQITEALVGSPFEGALDIRKYSADTTYPSLLALTHSAHNAAAAILLESMVREQIHLMEAAMEFMPANGVRGQVGLCVERAKAMLGDE